MALRQERVAQRLAELRERHALSQDKAAQKVGITHRQWQRWENGESMPRPANLGEVALAFGVPVTTFYDDEPERVTPNGDALLARLAALEDQVRLLRAELAAADAEALKRNEAVLHAIRRSR
jgi:transcriptional regulator with XRE-family HTH domain